MKPLKTPRTLKPYAEDAVWGAINASVKDPKWLQLLRMLTDLNATADNSLLHTDDGFSRGWHTVYSPNLFPYSRISYAGDVPLGRISF